jgi:hypothetical protein
MTTKDIIDQLGQVGTYNEQMETLVQQMAKQFDPTDYLAPSHREIARMPEDQLQSEYKLVLAKESTRSAAQRRMIVERVESIKTASDNV